MSEIDLYSEIEKSNNIRSGDQEYEQSWDGTQSTIGYPTTFFDDVVNVAGDIVEGTGDLFTGAVKGMPSGASKAGMEIADTLTGQWYSTVAVPWMNENIPGLKAINESVSKAIKPEGTAQEIGAMIGEVGTQIVAPGAMVTKSLQGANLGSRFLTNVLGYGATEALVIPAKDKGLIESAVSFLAQDNEATKALLETLEADEDLPYLLQKLQRTPLLMFEGGVIGESISEGLGALIKYGKNSPMLTSLKTGIKSKFQNIGEKAQQRLDQDTGGVTLSAMGGGEIDKGINKILSKLAPDYKEKIKQIALKRPNIKNKENPKIIVQDLHDFFDQEAIRKHGRKLSLFDEKDYNVIKNSLIDDIEVQLKSDVTGQGWYDADVLKTFNLASRIPGFEKLGTSETDRVILSAIFGATSPGPKVSQNTKSALAQYLKYKRTGKFSTEAPPPGTAVEGIEKAGFGQYGYPGGLKMLQFLLDKFGEDGFADFMLSPHTKKELTKLRAEAGFKSPPAGMSGTADSMHFGMAILGDKAGKFALNINGYQDVTKDRWFVRSIRRTEGTFADNLAKNQKGEMGELGQPKNQSERLLMDKLVKEIVDDPRLKDLKLTEQDAQAILWYREQNLYTDLGVDSRPESFSEGVENVSKQEGFGIRTSDEDKAKIESGEIEPSGFREFSKKQRAVRNSRRRFQELNNPGGAGGISRTYEGGSPGDAGGDGGLTFKPNADIKARYAKAGINAPIIKKVDSKTSANAYSKDMADAMSNHKYGLQVTIQKPEDLINSNLYRTEYGGGFVIKPDGDVVGVFNKPGSPPGSIYAMMQLAVEQGGKKLDAFNTFLPKIYETVGFKPVSRVKWNDEFAPEGWSKDTFKKYNNGEPDLILYVYDKNYFGGINKNDLPVFDGPDGYEQAQKIQTQALKELGTGDG